MFENECSSYTSDSQNLITTTEVKTSNQNDSVLISDSLFFRYNYFKNGYCALQLGGCYYNLGYPYDNIFKYSENNIIQSNIFQNFTDNGIYLIASRFNSIEGNRLVSDSANVIAFKQITSSVNDIKQNFIKLNNNGSGIVVEDFYGTQDSFLNVWNNIVTIFGPDTGTQGEYYGILCKNKITASAKVYHNTVSVFSVKVSASMALISALGVEIKKNIFSHYRKGYAISVDSYSSDYNVNRNNYYAPFSNIASFDGNDLVSINEIKSNGLDLNAFGYRPLLQNEENPTPLNCELDDKGSENLVSEDFYGNSRSNNSPDLGAIEFTAPIL